MQFMENPFKDVQYFLPLVILSPFSERENSKGDSLFKKISLRKGEKIFSLKNLPRKFKFLRSELIF